MQKLNRTQKEILDLFGGSANWNDITTEYSGKSEVEILEALNYMWPQEPQDANTKLANDIFNELN